MSPHSLEVPNVPSRRAGNQKGQAVRTAGRINVALAPRADVLKGDTSWVWSGGADPGCAESAAIGPSQSCCLLESPGWQQLPGKQEGAEPGSEEVLRLCQV